MTWLEEAEEETSEEDEDDDDGDEEEEEWRFDNIYLWLMKDRWMSERINEIMYKWINWKNEWMDEWINETRS